MGVAVAPLSVVSVHREHELLNGPGFAGDERQRDYVTHQSERAAVALLRSGSGLTEHLTPV